MLFQQKTFLFLNMIYLIKNTTNNLLNQNKFMFPPFQFDLFRDAVVVPECFISWRIFHEVYERDSKLQVHLRKAPKITNQVTHLCNNQLSVQLASAAFHETSTVTVRSYFPN